MLSSDLADVLDAPLPPKVRKLLDVAEAEGWGNPVVSLCVRLSKPDDVPRHPAEPPALPFFVTWLMSTNDGKRSWNFKMARAKNMQALNYGDSLIYLCDPAVIYPEPPENVRAEPGEPCYCDYYSFTPHTHPEPPEQECQ